MVGNEQDLHIELERYDAGYLGGGGGGDVGLWQDYIRCELERAHEFYQDQLELIEIVKSRIGDDQPRVKAKINSDGEVVFGEVVPIPDHLIERMENIKIEALKLKNKRLVEALERVFGESFDLSVDTTRLVRKALAAHRSNSHE